MDSRSPRSRSSGKSNHNMVSNGDSCNRPLRNIRGQSSSPTSSFVLRAEFAKEGKRDKDGKLSPFKLLLHDIAEELDKDDVETLKSFCSDDIRKRQMEKIEVAEQLFEKLHEKDIINDRKTYFLENLLRHSGKIRLLRKVEAYRRANTTDADTMTEESGSEILAKKRKLSPDSPDFATFPVPRKSVPKKQKRLTHSKLPNQDTDTMTEESDSELLAQKRVNRRKRSPHSPDFATPPVPRKSVPKKQKRFTHSKLPDQALSNLRSLIPNQEKYPDEILKVVAEPRLTSGEQQESLQFPVVDRFGVIRTCVAFGETAQRLYLEIDEGGVYVMSGYGIERPNPTFNKDPIRIVLDDISKIKSSDSDIFDGSLSYHRIDEAVKTEQRSHIRGIVRRIGELTDSPQARMKVREIFMVDESCQEMKVTFFKEDAENFNFLVGQTLKVKFVRGVPPNQGSEAYLKTTTFSTAAVSDTAIKIDDSKVKTSLPKYTGIKVESLKELKKSEIEGIYAIASVCTIATVSLSNPMYIGCDVEGCRRKVSVGINNRAVCPTHEFRYRTGLYFKISVQIKDSSGSILTTLFDHHVSAISDLTTDSIEKLPTKSQNKKITSQLKDVSVALILVKKGKGRTAEYDIHKISKV